MREVRITQKDFVTHTIFKVGHGGKTFPDGNYEIAKRWGDQGLLCESSQVEMDRINWEKIKERKFPGHGG